MYPPTLMDHLAADRAQDLQRAAAAHRAARFAGLAARERRAATPRRPLGSAVRRAAARLAAPLSTHAVRTASPDLSRCPA